MRVYFALKLLLLIIVIATWGALNSDSTGANLGGAAVAAIIGIDFAIIPVIYLIVSFVRKRKLRPGEYVIKPEGKQL